MLALTSLIVLHLVFTFVFQANPSFCAPVTSSTSPQWFMQPVDHFGLNNQQWKQQYLFNASFYQPGGPILMITPGEGPLTSYYTDETHWTKVAQQTNGLVVAVEHRFYGESNPMPDLSGNSLKYLTVENTLEDFASFIRQAQNNPQTVFPTINVKAKSNVLFGGGSYAGNIAAWMRAKYPDLVSGAWASSAVVYSRLENYQYDQSFGRHLGELGCAECFAQGVKDLDNILLSGDSVRVSEVQNRFGIPNPLSPADTAALISALVSAAANDPITKAGDPMDMAVCSFFKNSTRSCLDSYAAASRASIEWQGLEPDMLLVMGNSSMGLDYTALGQVPRVWYYQMCTWFGNWQVPPTTRKTSKLTPYRSRLLGLDFWQPNCQKKFGSNVKIPVDVAAFNRKWFDILKTTTNVYYTAGELEIWRDSTVAASYGDMFSAPGGSRIVVIKNANHVQDFQSESEDDLESVKRAREVGDRLVNKWLDQSKRHGSKWHTRYREEDCNK